jgi:hypothetical protein
MYPFSALLCLLIGSGFFLFPWVYYHRREKFSGWDRFVMSVALMIPMALACMMIAVLLFLLLDFFVPSIDFNHAGILAIVLPWIGVAWLLVLGMLKKRAGK